MDIKLIAFDLDGTFLMNDKRVPEENMAAIERAAGKGAVIVPATGRIFPGIPRELREADFIRYYICCNGASVYDKLEDKVLISAEISPASALSFVDYMKTLPVAYDCYMDNEGFMNEEFYNSLEDWISDSAMLKFVRSVRKGVPDLREMIAGKNRAVQKLQMFYTDMAERERQLELIPKLFPEFIATSSMPNNIEVNSRFATKGQALSRLCKKLGIDVGNALAFGDGTNDADMLAAAGVGAAMANASPALFEKADIIAPKNEECGVAAVISEYLALP